MIAFYVARARFNVLEKNTSLDKCMNKNYICYTLYVLSDNGVCSYIMFS